MISKHTGRIGYRHQQQSGVAKMDLADTVPKEITTEPPKIIAFPVTQPTIWTKFLAWIKKFNVHTRRILHRLFY